ncbi:hypothetical protein EDF60_1342 [Leucobacter luti]|uniref:hypothetical protein n=1 Tax=Leucobacter luti TaxID=340320 RepID=UPI00105068B8|nr:hypothetical protein [Leucobacter luti]MCW2287740.1 hypothetical protein [Leucobacter luti]TCK46095.1 hypothetical protein EDF60_1342 [Leucobacter luti]
MLKTRTVHISALASFCLLLSAQSVASAIEREPGDQSLEPALEGQSGEEIPGGLSEVEYYNLPVEKQVELKVQNEMTLNGGSGVGTIPSENIAFSNAITEFSDSIYSLGNAYPDVYSAFEVDSKLESISISVASKSSVERRDEFIQQVERVLASYPYPVTFPEIDFTDREVQSVADELSNDLETWQPRLGGGSYSINPSVKTGTVTVLTDGNADSEWEKFEINGIVVNVERSEEPIALPQTRLADVSPFYAGIRLNNSNNQGVCTSGFAWRKWSDNKVYGSTADHCYRDSGTSSFYNNGNHVGSRYLPASSADVMLLLPSAGRTFTGRTYVGVNSANASYPVKSASTRPVGAVIALHASFGTPFVTTVAAINKSIVLQTATGSYTIYGISWTWSNAQTSYCQGGDSGGPWVTDNGQGQAAAHGQHFGGIKWGSQQGANPNIYYCSYVDVNRISGATQSTLVTN